MPYEEERNQYEEQKMLLAKAAKAFEQETGIDLGNHSEEDYHDLLHAYMYGE